LPTYQLALVFFLRSALALDRRWTCIRKGPLRHTRKSLTLSSLSPITYTISPSSSEGAGPVVAAVRVGTDWPRETVFLGSRPREGTGDRCQNPQQPQDLAPREQNLIEVRETRSRPSSYKKSQLVFQQAGFRKT